MLQNGNEIRENCAFMWADQICEWCARKHENHSHLTR